jgi:hypothetical protein
VLLYRLKLESYALASLTRWPFSFAKLPKSGRRALPTKAQYSARKYGRAP